MLFLFVHYICSFIKITCTNLIKQFQSSTYIGSAFIIISYNFIVIQYFTKSLKKDTVFSIFINFFTLEVIYEICRNNFLKLFILSHSIVKKERNYLLIDKMCDDAINLSFREDNL